MSQTRLALRAGHARDGHAMPARRRLQPVGQCLSAPGAGAPR
jgi:hypothetical protein